MEPEKEPRMSWRRLNFDVSEHFDIKKPEERRRLAERETNRDLKKPIEQLVCDVHEESDDTERTELQNLIGTQKRMVSMLARVALSNDRVATLMLNLTIAIAGMTLVILIVTILMWIQTSPTPSGL